MKHGRILFITEDYSEKFYGVYTSMNQLETIIKDNFEVKIVAPNNTKKLWRYSGELKNKLEQLIPKVDIVHIHGIWQHPQYIAAKLAIKYNKPFIISLHGMLEPWVMDSKNIGILKSLKKRIYLKLVVSSVFGKAALIHAITEFEKKNLIKYFPKNRIEVIPNAVDVESIDNVLTTLPPNKPEKYILFLGRIHPIKGLDLLIKAFMSLKNAKNWKLKVVGPIEDKQYFYNLKMLANRDKRIEFLGEIWGKKKIELLKNAWILVLPSFSETIGMVNLEAAACFTPTITTYQTGLLDWQQGGNFLINPSEEELKEALKKAICWSLNERISRGLQTRKFVEKKYSQKVIEDKWINLYLSLIKEV